MSAINLDFSYTVEELAQLKDIFLYTLDDNNVNEPLITEREEAATGLSKFVLWLAQEDRRPLLKNLDAIAGLKKTY
jgi:hypothetical protein